jgi:aspartyl protease family protein
MLKIAFLFAGAGLAIVLMAPGLLPVLDRAAVATASQPPSSAVAAPEPASAPQPQPTRETESGFHEMQIPDNGSNQYFADAYVEGQSVRFIVDTGANIVSLNADTARQLGFSDAPSRPHYLMNTANGQTQAYGVHLRSIDLGSIYVADVDAVVNPNLGRMNLLGVNFLRRLSSVEQRDGRLILRQ